MIGDSSIRMKQDQMVKFVQYYLENEVFKDGNGPRCVQVSIVDGDREVVPCAEFVLDLKSSDPEP